MKNIQKTQTPFFPQSTSPTFLMHLGQVSEKGILLTPEGSECCGQVFNQDLKGPAAVLSAFHWSGLFLRVETGKFRQIFKIITQFVIWLLKTVF